MKKPWMPRPWIASGASGAAGASGSTAGASGRELASGATACDGLLQAARPTRSKRFTRAVWACPAQRRATALLPATAAAAERVLDERSDLVDELRRAHEANGRGGLAERHVLEQARQRDRA